MSLINSSTSAAIHSSFWGDAKAALHVSGRPSDVRLRTGASASTSGASPVVTVAPVEVKMGVEVTMGEEGAPVEVGEGRRRCEQMRVVSCGGRFAEREAVVHAGGGLLFICSPLRRKTLLPSQRMLRKRACCTISVGGRHRSIDCPGPV